eukprot:3654694-Rhodomonas_salina.1
MVEGGAHFSPEPASSPPPHPRISSSRRAHAVLAICAAAVTLALLAVSVGRDGEVSAARCRLFCPAVFSCSIVCGIDGCAESVVLCQSELLQGSSIDLTADKGPNGEPPYHLTGQIGELLLLSPPAALSRLSGCSCGVQIN